LPVRGGMTDVGLPAEGARLRVDLPPDHVITLVRGEDFFVATIHAMGSLAEVDSPLLHVMASGYPPRTAPVGSWTTIPGHLFGDAESMWFERSSDPADRPGD
jgi:hypothetical protein